MSNFKSDNPDPAKGTPATGKAPQKIDPETKEAGILATCLASLCCCFAAGGVALSDELTP
ncbi:hypothetical protein ACSBR1_019411 [Camellia fascicularis]